MSLQDNFRKAMRSYVYSVSILSNVSESKEYHAITVSSVTSVSIDPPSILVCINKTAGIHDSIKLGSKYCINLLTKDHEELSNICSSYEEEKNRFASDLWDISNIPFIKDAQANIFCEVDQLIEYHTHTIVIGKVIESTNKDIINTLTYVDGSYE
jgi:flavin reductase (DIM6/NTAB) family NADH-FMN oxidoreductase RutF